MSTDAQVEFLLIGHACHDRLRSSYLLGGTVSYAGMFASRLGYRTAVLTSFGADFQFAQRFSLEGVRLKSIAAEQTTIFENQYVDQQRTQRMLAKAANLQMKHLPAAWKHSPVVLLGPIADEVSTELIHAFPKSLLGATIQGWLRQANNKNVIEAKAMDWSLLQAVDILFLSEEDIMGVPYALESIIDHGSIVVLTKGEKGATVFRNREAYEFPAFPVEATDPTGAGDIFATAFLLKYYRTKNLTKAAAFAHAAASIIVEQKGLRIPDQSLLDARYDDYLQRFAN